MSDLKEKLRKAWENRTAIAEGFYNEYISSNKEVEQEKERRREICRKCEYYSKTGQEEIMVVKGEPGCLLCGCNEKLMTAAMSYQCSAYKIGLTPRWSAITTDEMEKEYNTIAYKKQFEKPTE